MANALGSAKANSCNVLTSVAVETLNGTTAVLSAIQNSPIGGKLYVAGAAIVATNGSATVTPQIQGSFDGTNFFKLSDLKASDLSTAATLASGTASTVIGAYDLRNIVKVPYWRIGAVGDGATTATFKSHILVD
jgi:hypothetical protein